MSDKGYVWAVTLASGWNSSMVDRNGDQQIGEPSAATLKSMLNNYRRVVRVLIPKVALERAGTEITFIIEEASLDGMGDLRWVWFDAERCESRESVIAEAFATLYRARRKVGGGFE